MSARERILARARAALAERPRVPHPGPFRSLRATPLPEDPLDAFSEIFRGAGGEVARVASDDDAAAWIGDFAASFPRVIVGATLPAHMAPHGLLAGSPEGAELGISMARGAVAETGSLLLDSRDGRLAQILPPTHLVIVRASTVYSTLVAALGSLRPSLPAAVALHSGPSKSADIGQILVRGVHGPGRIVALLIEA